MEGYNNNNKKTSPKRHKMKFIKRKPGTGDANRTVSNKMQK